MKLIKKNCAKCHQEGRNNFKGKVVEGGGGQNVFEKDFKNPCLLNSSIQ